MNTSAKTDIGVGLFAAGLAATVVSISALIRVVDSDIFAFMSLPIAVIGFAASWLYIKRSLPKQTRDFIIGMAIALSILVVLMSPAIMEKLRNPYSISPTDPTIPALLSWCMAVYCFCITSRDSLVFLLVPSLSLLGLSTNLTHGQSMLPYYIAFVFAACFVLLLQNSKGERVFRRHVTAALAIAAASMLLGCILTTGFMKIDKSLYRHFMSSSTLGYMKQFAPSSFKAVATGPAPDSDAEVMTVECNEALLWRGEIYNEFNGKGWRNTVPESNDTIKPIIPKQQRGQATYIRRTYKYKLPVTGTFAKTREVKQVFRPTEYTSRVIFGAAEPTFISTDAPLSRITWEGGIRCTAGCEPGKSFTVISRVPGVFSFTDKNDTKYPPEIRKSYLDTPSSCKPVEELTMQITKDEKSAYSKAVAIAGYLQNNYEYDLNAPATPSDKDAVVNFLFSSKKGYCEIFSTSMVVMCRQAGLPARWVTGFTSGKYSAKDDLYHVRMKDAHAWVEVYFPEYGWMTFDPTPAGSEPDTSYAAYLKKAWKSIVKYRRNIGLVAGSIIALVILKSLVIYVVVNARRIYSRKRRIHGAIEENYMRMLEMMAHAGYPHDPAETPSEYAASSCKDLPPSVTSAVQQITNDFQEVRYAERTLSKERATSGILRLAEIRAGLRKVKTRGNQIGKKTGSSNSGRYDK